MRGFISKMHGVYAAILCMTFALGFAANTATHRFFPAAKETAVEKALRETGKYTYISPLLLCGTNAAADIDLYRALERKIIDLVKKEKDAGNVSNVAVYFRGANGSSFGIDEDTEYAPASLLKVPLMIAYFKLAEKDPSILNKQLTYLGNSDLNAQQIFKADYHLVRGGSYTVLDLIRGMIINSDNNATKLLEDNIDQKLLESVYTDLGLAPIANNAPEDRTLNVKMYSYFFRVLYNATYLNPEHSEKAMEILTHASFPQGIRGGVPAEVPIAQKFGERTIIDGTLAVSERDLHDCGLVYAPKRTYLLCIMTQGKDFEKLSEVLKDISATIYAEVDSMP